MKFCLLSKLSVRYYGENKEELGTARLYLTAVGKLRPRKHNIYSKKIIYCLF